MILAVCGYGTHGKGTFCQLLAGLTTLRYTQSTSEAAAEVVFAAIGTRYGYANSHECWLDRRNHRAEWFDIIREYNKPDGMTLYREMLKTQDILEGIRDSFELRTLKEAGLVQKSVWISAEKRLPPELIASNNVTQDDCDAWVGNNGTRREFIQKVQEFIDFYGLERK